MRAWSVGGQDLLWTPDPAVWNAVAPVLFPIVGWARDGEIRVDGRRYAMGVHGFAARRLFAVESSSATRLRLVDRADAETLRHYPFAYRLTIEFALSAAHLGCTIEIANEDCRPMPYAVGLHPGFRWPHGPAHLVFDEAEAPDVPVITDAGLFAPARHSLPFAGKTLPLTRELLSREALCFLDTRSRGFVYAAAGVGQLRIEHEGFAHLALWSRPPAPFLCIESWTGHGDPDGFDGELSVHPSIRSLAPGAMARHAVRYGFTNLPTDAHL